MRRAELKRLAKRAGLTVVEHSSYFTVQRGSVGVAVYEDGEAHRVDVDLTIATKMTIDACAKLLKLA